MSLTCSRCVIDLYFLCIWLVLVMSLTCSSCVFHLFSLCYCLVLIVPLTSNCCVIVLFSLCHWHVVVSLPCCSWCVIGLLFSLCHCLVLIVSLTCCYCRVIDLFSLCHLPCCSRCVIDLLFLLRIWLVVVSLTCSRCVTVLILSCHWLVDLILSLSAIFMSISPYRWLVSRGRYLAKRTHTKILFLKLPHFEKKGRKGVKKKKATQETRREWRCAVWITREVTLTPYF